MKVPALCALLLAASMTSASAGSFRYYTGYPATFSQPNFTIADTTFGNAPPNRGWYYSGYYDWYGRSAVRYDHRHSPVYQGFGRGWR